MVVSSVYVSDLTFAGRFARYATLSLGCERNLVTAMAERYEPSTQVLGSQECSDTSGSCEPKPQLAEGPPPTYGGVYFLSSRVTYPRSNSYSNDGNSTQCGSQAPANG